MLYKVTPMMPAPEEAKKAARKAREPGQPRKRRKTAIYDGDGQEVLITLMCLKCKGMKPLAQFGLRKMADGAIRNQPWCRTCRGATGTKKRGSVEVSVIPGNESPASVRAPSPEAAVAQTVEARTAPVSAEAMPVDAAAELPVSSSEATATAESLAQTGATEARQEGEDGSSYIEAPRDGEEAAAPGSAASLEAAPIAPAEVSASPAHEPVAFAAAAEPEASYSTQDEEATHPSTPVNSDVHAE